MDLVTLSLAKNYTNEQRTEVEAELNGKTNQAAIGDAYSSSSTYVLFDICTYLGTRYKCTSAISTPEAWNPAHWTEESTQTVLDSYASQLSNKANRASTSTNGNIGTVDEFGNLLDGGVALSNVFVLTYTQISDTTNVFACDMLNHVQKNFYFTISDTAGKTITLSNVPNGRCEVFFEITASATAAITWELNGGTINWELGISPVLTIGYIYRILLITNDSGTTWDGYASGGVS